MVLVLCTNIDMLILLPILPQGPSPQLDLDGQITKLVTVSRCSKAVGWTALLVRYEMKKVKYRFC